MTKFDFVFVVLVYRNTQDLTDFFLSNETANSRVIVVNSYYDDDSEKAFQLIAQKYNADFLTVPNKGYGAGNNRGIEYALQNYEFRYLVVSNADILVKNMALSCVSSYGDSIIAPQIINAIGRKQNPSVPFRPTKLTEDMKYWVYQGSHYRILWILFALSRFKKILYYCISGIRKQIFSAHGSFVIMSKKVVERLHPIYNEDMFLFNEEEHLGRLALKNGIKTYYAKNIQIHHKEDGSMKLSSFNEMERLRQSFLVYYDYWFGKH